MFEKRKSSMYSKTWFVLALLFCCLFFFSQKNHPKFNCCTCKNAEGCCKNDCFLKINPSSLRGIQCQGGEEGDSFYKGEERR